MTCFFVSSDAQAHIHTHACVHATRRHTAHAHTNNVFVLLTLHGHSKHASAQTSLEVQNPQRQLRLKRHHGIAEHIQALANLGVLLLRQ